MPAVDLPAEVEELVIDHLYEETESLGCCGLVCKWWLKRSRYHLFGAVSVHTGNWRGFVQLFNSPQGTITPFIHTLIVTGSHSEPIPYLNRMLARLPIFPALKSLRFYDITWPHVSKATVDCLAELAVDVTELSLLRVVFRSPPHLIILLSRFSRLQNLSVEFRFWSLDGSGDPWPADTQSSFVARTLECVRLENVHRDPTGQVIAWLNPVVDAPPIRALQVEGIRWRVMTSLGKLLCSLGPLLHELDLHFVFDVTAAGITTHVDLAPNICLRHLTLHPSETKWVNAPWALFAALHCNVAMLTLELPMTSVDVLDEFEWRDLNTTLKAQFPALRRLQILVKDGVLNQGESSLRAALAEYGSRGMLEIEQQVIVVDT